MIQTLSWRQLQLCESNGKLTLRGAHTKHFSVVKCRLNHFYEISFYCPARHPSCPTPPIERRGSLARDKNAPIKDYPSAENETETHLMSNLSKIIKSLRVGNNFTGFLFASERRGRKRDGDKKKEKLLSFCFLLRLKTPAKAFYNFFPSSIFVRLRVSGNYLCVCFSHHPSAIFNGISRAKITNHGASSNLTTRGAINSVMKSGERREDAFPRKKRFRIMSLACAPLRIEGSKRLFQSRWIIAFAVEEKIKKKSRLP